MSDHETAFKDGKVIQPITPRGMLEVCRAIVSSLVIHKTWDSDKHIKRAFDKVVMNRANPDDRRTMMGLLDRQLAGDVSDRTRRRT